MREAQLQRVRVQEGRLVARAWEAKRKETSGGQTVLHRVGRKEAVEVLLRAGADTAAKDEVGDTALHCACRNGRTEVVDALLRAGADLDVKNNKGQTPLDFVRRKRTHPIVALVEAWRRS
ncbi:Ankyrin repeat domain-containing protein 6 [Tetrabaena socialis]|uniref:Ankyrin repeat domain-containing protein 6 n=1 Tax=Tetrabaena socialis TaxID=47790 RepID=A0A2J8A3P7_9CHLO|nr:Ankyrin repeat domain-containing protein 6 [Tetrabaena socialis]|eukprot:PNH07134.1 Ankyrin repeat domain-containing protein 6 [Tetrabaena socialis]